MTEQETFYRRANTAVDVTTGLVAGYGLSLVVKQLPHRVRAWMGGAVWFLILWGITVMVRGATTSNEDFLDGKSQGSNGWMIFCLVAAGICGAMMCFEILRSIVTTILHPPQAAAPALMEPQPTPPPPTQTVVERSVRVVRAPAATTTHQNATAAPTASQGPHNDVVAPKQLTIVTGPTRRALHIEEHDGFTSYDRRSFDRDLEQ